MTNQCLVLLMHSWASVYSSFSGQVLLVRAKQLERRNHAIPDVSTTQVRYLERQAGVPAGYTSRTGRLLTAM